MKKLFRIMFTLLIVIVLFTFSVTAAEEKMDKLSYDTVGYTPVGGSEVMLKDGMADDFLKNNPQSFNEGEWESVYLRGWAGDSAPIETFGYKIDGGEFVAGDFAQATEEPVRAAGGEHASRFKVVVPVKTLKPGEHVATAYAKLTVGDELYLTSLDYEEFYLHGDDEPFYGFIPHTGEYLEVNGIRYENGIFINPVSGSDDGYIIYNIEGLPYDRFVAKVGKLDVFHGNGDPVVFRVYVDGELVAESEEMVQGDDAYLFDVEIGEGKKELLLECSVVTMDHTECSSVFGDARLCYNGRILEIASFPFTVLGDSENPETGSNTMVIVMFALVAMSMAFVLTKKRVYN